MLERTDTPMVARRLTSRRVALLVRRGLWMLAGLLVLAASPGLARTINVDGPEGLRAALKEARPGDVLLLAPGDYGELRLSPRGAVDPRFEGPVTIRSAKADDRAIFTGLLLNRGRNIIFDTLLFDYRATEGTFRERPFRIRGSSEIVVRNSIFDGDDASGLDYRANGFGAGNGLGVGAGSTNITVENNKFMNFRKGLGAGKGSGLVVRGNEFTGMRIDGMTFVMNTDLLIEGNYLHSFRRNLKGTDHSDMIQFWTTNTEIQPRNITIRGNVLNMGDGLHTHSIFIRNQAVDNEGAGREMFYKNVLIEENVIINGHLHGISIGESDGLTIRNNTLIRVPRKGLEAGERGKNKWRPIIRVSPDSFDVAIYGNIAPRLPSARDGWRVRDNLIIQEDSPMKPGHYIKVFKDGFAPAPYALDNFRYRADGPAAAGFGASMLR